MPNQTPFRHIKGEKKKDRWTGRKDALRVGSLQANQASTPFCEAPDSHFPGSAVETSPAARGEGGGMSAQCPTYLKVADHGRRLVSGPRSSTDLRFHMA